MSELMDEQGSQHPSPRADVFCNTTPHTIAMLLRQRVIHWRVQEKHIEASFSAFVIPISTDAFEDNTYTISMASLSLRTIVDGITAWIN